MIYSTELKIKLLEARKNLLMARDPAGNANLIHKIDRQIRNLSK